MTTETTTKAIPAWLNFDALNIPPGAIDEAHACVALAREMLPAFAALASRAVEARVAVEHLTEGGDWGDDVSETIADLTGSGQLREVFLVIAGLAEEVGDGSPTDSYFEKTLEKFGLDEALAGVRARAAAWPRTRVSG